MLMLENHGDNSSGVGIRGSESQKNRDPGFGASHRDCDSRFGSRGLRAKSPNRDLPLRIPNPEPRSYRTLFL